MDYLNLIQSLEDKNQVIAHEAMKKLLEISENTDAIYPYISKFFKLLNSSNAFLRCRAALLIIRNAQWDTDEIIEQNVDTLLAIAKDHKATTARQIIQALPELVIAKPSLKERIIDELMNIDPLKYPDTTSHLIKNDVQNALNIIREIK